MSDKPRMTAAEAGRKGGRSRSAKKLAAIRQKGFQPRKPATEPLPLSPENEKPAARPVLVVPRA